ncbi:MAG: SDR family oxidoreductase [Myxococcales bacterium]|nr:SDR family oxidoreductase [Myxococcales bacterium]
MIAVVTGASRGIGRATALSLARRGVDVALLGRPSEALDACQRELSEMGARSVVVGCDVASPAGVGLAAARVFSELGVPDIVVNNAGIVRRGASIDAMEIDDWSDVIATNLTGPFLVTRAFLPAMKRAKQGRLIFVSSISATLGCPNNAAYGASKWGLEGFTKSLAEELRGTGLLCASVRPGSVDTDLLAGSGFPPAMSATDVASMISYLALDAPAAIHGSSVEMFG